MHSAAAAPAMTRSASGKVVIVLLHSKRCIVSAARAARILLTPAIRWLYYACDTVRTMTAHSPQIFSISASPDPICQQLVDQVSRYVAGGRLAPGDRLPSSRQVAQALGVNPMTVSNAYSLLRERGLLASRRGASMVVAEGVVVQSVAERAAQLQPALQRAIREARQLQLDDATVLELAARLLKADR